MTTARVMMDRCPRCDSLFMVPQDTINTALQSGGTVFIACYHCDTQFEADKSRHLSLAGRTGAPSMRLGNCPGCKGAVSIPDPLPDKHIIQICCPLCESVIDSAMLTKTAHAVPEEKLMQTIVGDGHARPQRDDDINRVPLYLLILVILGGLLYWARETGQLPIDQWLRLLGVIS